MTVITVNGQIGSGGVDLAAHVARKLELDLVDRLILAEAARRLGSTVAALAEKEQRMSRLSDRLARFLQTLLERSAISGTGGDPFYVPGVEALVARDYTETVHETSTPSQQVEDQHFIEATKTAIMDVALADRVVIVGRGGNMVLRDMPGVLHVGVVAPMERRLRTVVERDHVDPREAERFVIEHERARVAFFKKFFKVHPDDPLLYHLVFNLGVTTIAQAVDAIAAALPHVGAISPGPAKAPAGSEPPAVP